MVVVTKPRTEKFKESFCFIGPVHWNMLPIELKLAVVLNQLKYDHNKPRFNLLFSVLGSSTKLLIFTPHCFTIFNYFYFDVHSNLLNLLLCLILLFLISCGLLQNLSIFQYYNYFICFMICIFVCLSIQQLNT